MKTEIGKFDKFVRGSFVESLYRRWENCEVVTEADLQVTAWILLDDYFRRRQTGGAFRVFNQPTFRRLDIRPDLVVFKRRTLWALIELKIRKRFVPTLIQKDEEKLNRVRRRLKSVKCAYLVYLSRRGRAESNRSPCFVPVVMEARLKRKKEFEGG